MSVQGAPKLVFEERCDSKGVVINLQPQPEATTLRVMLLTSNFTWAPRYKINLVGQTALVFAQACIIVRISFSL